MPAAPPNPSAPALVSPKRARLSVTDQTRQVDAAKVQHQAGVGIVDLLAVEVDPCRTGRRVDENQAVLDDLALFDAEAVRLVQQHRRCQRDSHDQQSVTDHEAYPVGPAFLRI